MSCTGPKCSKPPSYAGLCAGARGLADYSTRDADALLLWYRSGGRIHRREVQCYIARRCIAAGWLCTIEQAAAIIEEAMLVVVTRRHRVGTSRARMRKGQFLDMRAQVSAWLRAGIMDALWRYGLAEG
jgi:hypothetical protein